MNTLLSIKPWRQPKYDRLVFAGAGLLLLLLALLIPIPAHAAISAHVDRDTINEGETFTLNLSVTGSDSGDPDLSPLHQDFDVVGTSQRSEIQIINGSIQSHHSWSITLSPHHPGKLVIPPITVGHSSSAALTVTVLPATASIDNGVDKGDVFLEVSAKPDNVYVQAQLLYTVRLYYDAPLRQGTLSDPKLDNAIIQKLGSDSNFDTQRGGRHYQVIERRYAIFPQRSGPLKIPAVVFDGAISDPSAQTGNPFFDSINPVARHVRLRSRTLDIQVATQPANYQGTNWLPAQALTLKQKWSPQQPQFHVGEPVTRTVIIHAKGLSASQLPDLPLSNQTGFKFYPDQPQTSNTPSGDTLVSEREQKIAMIPTQAGDVTLPAIQLNWWDTQAKQQRTAVLPAQTIHVLPALATDSGTATITPAPKSPALAANPAQTNTAPVPTANKSIEESNNAHGSMPLSIWIALAAFFALAWLLTLLLWWRNKRPRKTPTMTNVATNDLSEQAALKHVRQAAQQNDQQAAKRALLAWAHLHWPNDPPLSLGALATRVDDSELAGVLTGLDKVLYEADASPWRAGHLLQCFDAYLKHSHKREHQDKSAVLAPLHLNKTRVAGN